MLPFSRRGSTELMLRKRLLIVHLCIERTIAVAGVASIGCKRPKNK
jgi:hypothetical protein